MFEVNNQIEGAGPATSQKSPDDCIETIEVESTTVNEFNEGNSDGVMERRDGSVEELERIRLGIDEQSDEIDNEEQIRLVIGAPELLHDQLPSYSLREAHPKKRYRMQRRQPATEYYCEKCDKTFRHPSKIAEHLRKHTGEKPFLCHLCGARFTQQHPLKVHLRSHRGEKPYKCSYCEKQFVCLSHAKEHEKVHLKEEDELSVGHIEPTHVYACPVINCLFNSPSKTQVEDHIDRDHFNVPENLSHNAQWVEEEEYEYEHQLMENGISIHGEDLPLVEGEEIIEEIIHEQDMEYQDMTEQLEDHENHSIIASSSQIREHLKEDGSRGISQLGENQQLNERISEIQQNSDVNNTLQVEDSTQMSAIASISNISAHTVGDDQMLSGSEQNQHFHRVNSEILHEYHNPFPESSEYVENEVYFDDDYITDEVEEEIVHGDHDPNVAGPSTSDYTVTKFEVHSSEQRSYEFNQQAPPNHEQEIEIVTSSQQNADLMAVVSGVELGGVYDGYIGEAEEHDGIKMMEYMMTESIVMDDRVRVYCDPRPPRKGRNARYGEYIRNMESPLREVVVDSSILEMAAPMKPVHYPRRRANRGSQKPARNLDWIIDAVARGVDVNLASPHNRRKPVMHECQFCGRIDKYPSKIEAHRRTHTGEKPYKCDICGMAFAQRTPMRMHVRRHLDQKHFKCVVEGCEMRFVSGALLNAHVQSKHEFPAGRRYVCLKGCGRSFANSRSQRRHEARCTFADRVYEQTILLPDYDENLYMEEDEEIPEDAETVDEDDIIGNMQPAFLDLST